MALTAEQKQQLIVKAMQDEAFRTALQRDARATIAQALQVTLPSEVTLHVLAPAAQTLCLVLPPYPAEWPAGLSVEALEQRLTAGTGQLEAAPQTVARGQARLVAKAWQDAAYKQALLQDPKGVIAREFGEGLPAEVAVQVVAEDAHTQYLILPPALENLELSDEQLEQVAGGEVIIALTSAQVAIAVSVAVVGSATVASAAVTASYGISKW